jgi:hypothetical protein
MDEVGLVLVFAAYMGLWAYTCLRIAREERLPENQRGLLAAVAVFLGPLTFAYWLWLLLSDRK